MLRFQPITSMILLLSTAVFAADRYKGYLPTTNITDIAAIDLDQEELNIQISNLKLENAMNVYRLGGNSGSYAIMTILIAPSSTTYPAGTVVQGTSEVGDPVNGTLLEKFHGSNGTVKVRYDFRDHQFGYIDCRVGGLYKFEAAERSECFQGSGNLSFIVNGSVDNNFTYEYDSRSGNKNTRTLQLLSTNASKSMIGSDGKYYKEFELFREYYGDADFGDKWINAAYLKQNTGFTSKRGDSNFSTIQNRLGQGEAMKKGSAYLIIWMEVIRALNEAVSDCLGNVDLAEQSVDEAVAFYAGSLASQENNEGILIYALAEIRAHQMKTAGNLDDMDVGDAFINVEIFRELKKMQSFVLSDDVQRCNATRDSKDRIITLMKVPMIQSVIRYAYHQDKEPGINQEEQEKMISEGATFAAVVLPFVHACDSRAAEVIHNNMKFGVMAKYNEVLIALESTYECLGVTCEEIGGVWDSGNQRYKNGANACGIETDEKSTAATVSMSIGIIVGMILAGVTNYGLLPFSYLLL